MTLTFIFWFLMLVWLLWGGFTAYQSQPAGAWWYPLGHPLLLFLLLLILGLQVFGWPIKGG